MPLKNILNSRKKYPIQDGDLDSVIKVFESFFQQYHEQKDMFLNLEDNNLDNQNKSAEIYQLSKIEKENLNELINKNKNYLKDRFLNNFLEKKINLNLIQEIRKFLELSIIPKITKQESQLLKLEENKLLIEKNKINNHENKNNEVTDFQDYFGYFNFLLKKANNDLSYLKKINSIFIFDKKEFLDQLKKTKINLENQIEELYKENEKIEIKNNILFDTFLLKEDVITKFVLIFWAFRMKNDDDKYVLVSENKKDIKQFDGNYNFCFELIDFIFNEYIIQIIKNEEKIFDNIFKPYNSTKSSLKEEQKNYDEKTKINNTEIEKYNQELNNDNEKILEIKNQNKNKKQIIKKFKNRRKNIKNKIQTCKKDWEENKDIQILNQIDFDNKKSKKQYLTEIENLIEKYEKEINNNDNEIEILEENVIRCKAEINIRNKKIKKSKKVYQKNEISLKENDYIMIYELKKIKENWIKKISENQKKFLLVLKDINKLEDLEFIKFIENYYQETKDNQPESSLMNASIQMVDDENNKKLEEIKINFEKTNEIYQLKEKEIIKDVTQETTQKFNETIETINKSTKLINDTEGLIIEENIKNIEFNDQKLTNENEKVQFLKNELKKREEEIEILLEKMSKINKEFECEKAEWKAEIKESKKIDKKRWSENLFKFSINNNNWVKKSQPSTSEEQSSSSKSPKM